MLQCSVASVMHAKNVMHDLDMKITDFGKHRFVLL